MSTVLTQSTIAAHPDRPAKDGTGLLVAMAEGDQGAYLKHALESEQDGLHVRLTFNPSGLSEGRVVMLACEDGSATIVLRLSYDATLHTINVWFVGGAVLTAQVDAVLGWQCVEVGVDTIGGQAGLWLNGQLVDEYIGDVSGCRVQTVAFGAIHKQTALTGDLSLDELCMAESYIGPIVVDPVQANASDPARWLVVYNASIPDAGVWADAYRQARGVPFANLLGLALPAEETINGTQYAEMVNHVDDYLSENQLDGQIIGVLLGYGVPGYVDFDGGGAVEAIPALMQTRALSAGTSINPHASDTAGQRLTISDLTGVRMTARLDGQNAITVNQLIARADSLMSVALGGDDSVIYFDPFVGTNPAYQSALEVMLNWATGLGGQRTRLPIKLSGDPSGNTEASFTSATGEGFFWGWSSTLPDADIFDLPAGRRAVCAQLFLEGASATTLRNETASNWAELPITAGYAAVIVSSRDNPIGALPNAGAFFDALREGWTLGEAWFNSQPYLRSGYYLVGDPLMTVNLPKQGFDVYGPVQNLEAMVPDSPAYVLASDQNSVDVSADALEEGLVRHYVIRRVDELGRREASSTSVGVVKLDDVIHPAMPMPVWPEVADWPVDIDNGRVRLIACFADRAVCEHLSKIEVLGQAFGQSLEVAVAPTWDPLDRFVTVTLPLPSDKTRYRWRFTSDAGVEQHTPLSAWIDPVAQPSLNLQTTGAST